MLDNFQPPPEHLPPNPHPVDAGGTVPDAWPRETTIPLCKTLTAECARCVLRRGLVRARLPEALVTNLCNRMWLLRGRKRQVLFTEGSPAMQLFALRSGAVKLLRIGDDGRHHVTAVLESGTLFGCEALFEPTYSTDAEMIVDGEVCVADASTLATMLREAPSLGLDLAHFLHHQLAIARQRLAILGAPSARAKLAGHLLLRLEEASEAGSIRQDLTQEELGGMLGLSGETVCRTLADLRDRGVIETDRQAITVRDLATLRRLAGF